MPVHQAQYPIRNGITLWLNEVGQFRTSDMYVVGGVAVFVMAAPQYGNVPYADISIDYLRNSYFRERSTEYDTLTIPLQDLIFNTGAKVKLDEWLDFLRTQSQFPIPSLMYVEAKECMKDE